MLTISGTGLLPHVASLASTLNVPNLLPLLIAHLHVRLLLATS